MRFISLIIGLALFSPAFVWASFDHVVINQVQLDGLAGVGGTEDDWVELYNPTGSIIDLNGWSIQKTSASGGSLYRKVLTGSIPAMGYFLIVRDHADTSASLKVAADVLAAGSGFSLADNNTIYLVSNNEDITDGADLDIVDLLGLGDSTIFEGTAAPNPNDGESLERLAQDTEDNFTDFVLQAVPNPRNSSFVPAIPPLPPEPTSPGSSAPTPEIPAYSDKIIISEFMPNPDGSDSGEEWVELFNPSSVAVDLTGWIIDDESSTGAVGSSALILPEGTHIASQEYLVILLPEKTFALNNSGGDEVRLIWPDEQIASSVVYTDSAPVDESYARDTSGNYLWTSLVTKGEANQFPVSKIEEKIEEGEKIISTYMDFRINEIFPNPEGPDSGSEWIEIINVGSERASTHNWILDDGLVGEKIGASAYSIQSPIIDPGGVAHILIPAGKFAMNNTGEETVRLFNPTGILIDSISYEGSEEGMSLSLISGVWTWVIPTPSEPNLQAESQNKLTNADTQIFINEVLPEPSNNEEFIELINLGDAFVDLKGWKIADNAKSYTIKNFSLDPGEIKILTKTETGIALNNFGLETVMLIDPNGVIMSEIEYEDAPKDQSYNLLESGEYVWSITATPGKPNQIQSGDGIVKGSKLPVTGATTDYIFWGVAMLLVFWYSFERRKINHA